MSVPNQNACDGGRKRLIGATSWGSIVPSHGAKIAIPTMLTRMAPPMSAVGWRLKASRKRRHVGDMDLTGTIAGATTVSMSVADPRIEEHVRQIDQKIDQYVDGGKNQYHALDDRVVAAKDRVDGQAPDPRQREHRLGHDRAADQQRNPDTDDRHHRNGRVLERVTDENLIGRESFRGGGADVVLREDVDHAGAGSARDQCDVNGPQRDARQDQMAQPLPYPVAKIPIALHRQPVELYGESKNQDVGEHEYRNRKAEDGERHHRAIDPGARPVRRDDAERYCDQDRDDKRAQR